MAKLYKFPNKSNKSKKYSKEFLKKIDPNAIGDFIKEKNPQISIRAADALALAIIYSTHLQLVFEEEGSPIPIDVMQEFETNSHEQFLWNHDPKKTLH